MAVAAQELGAKLVFLSTEYLRRRRETHTTSYTELDRNCSSVAGAEGKGGNFVKTMLRLAKEREQLIVVSD